MRLKTLVCMILLSGCAAFAQTRQNVFLELAGSGIGVAFDSRFHANTAWGYRIGIGTGFVWINGKLTNFQCAVPFGVNYLVGKDKHFLEIGAGAALGFEELRNIYRINTTNFPMYTLEGPFNERDFFGFGFANVGYRFQHKKGFAFRAGLEPIYVFKNDIRTSGFTLAAYLSFGYAF